MNNNYKNTQDLFEKINEFKTNLNSKCSLFYTRDLTKDDLELIKINTECREKNNASSKNKNYKKGYRLDNNSLQFKAMTAEYSLSKLFEEVRAKNYKCDTYSITPPVAQHNQDKRYLDFTFLDNNYNLLLTFDVKAQNSTNNKKIFNLNSKQYEDMKDKTDFICFAYHNVERSNIVFILIKLDFFIENSEKIIPYGIYAGNDPFYSLNIDFIENYLKNNA